MSQSCKKEPSVEDADQSILSKYALVMTIIVLELAAMKLLLGSSPVSRTDFNPSPGCIFLYAYMSSQQEVNIPAGKVEESCDTSVQYYLWPSAALTCLSPAFPTVHSPGIEGWQANKIFQ